MEDEEEQKVEIEIPISVSLILKTKLDYLSGLDDEVAGWIIGEVKKEYIFLEDILLPKQEVTSASVEIDPSAGPGLLKEFKEKCKKILGHWHSHAGMSCFWSSTDEENINQIMQPRKFFVFMVSSEGKHLLRLESKIPFRMSIDNMKFGVYDKNIAKVHNQLDKELARKVSKKEFKTNGISESDEKILKSQFGLEGNDRVLKEVDSGKVIDNDFALELGCNIMAEYTGSTLTVSGLDFHIANILYKEFREYSPTLGGDSFYNKTINFILKRKKARRLVNKIFKLVGEYYPDDFDYTQDLDYRP